jgi:hypothetical protein
MTGDQLRGSSSSKRLFHRRSRADGIAGGVCVALCAFVVVLSSCAKDATSPGSDYGVYTLVSVNGNAPPVTILDSAVNGMPVIKDVWNSGTVDLESNGTWTVILNQTITFGGAAATAPDTSAGTWTRSGNAFSLRNPASPSDPPVAGTLSGRDLTITAPITGLNRTIVAVFRR